MTEHPGVPGSERAELTGLQDQSARARDNLREAVTRLSATAASRPVLPELARRGAVRAGQRALHRAGHAIPPTTRDAVARPFRAGPGTRAGTRLAAPAVAALAAVLVVAAAVAVVRLRHNH